MATRLIPVIGLDNYVATMTVDDVAGEVTAVSVPAMPYRVRFILYGADTTDVRVDHLVNLQEGFTTTIQKNRRPAWAEAERTTSGGMQQTVMTLPLFWIGTV